MSRDGGEHPAARVGILRAQTLPPALTCLLTQTKKGAKLTVHPDDDVQHFLRMGDGPAGHMDAVGESIQSLAATLSSMLGRPVTDGSGLTGRYDFKLDWTRDPGSPPDHADDTAGPSIISALTDQLGELVQIDVAARYDRHHFARTRAARERRRHGTRRCAFS